MNPKPPKQNNEKATQTAKVSPLAGLDLSKIRSPTPEEVAELRENAQRYIEDKEKPRRPGDYDIGASMRGSKTNQTCKVCSGELEHVLHQTQVYSEILMHNRSEWSLKCTRCSKCGLCYDLVGIV